MLVLVLVPCPLASLLHLPSPSPLVTSGDLPLAPFGFAYGVIAVEDAEVLAGPYLGGGPVGCNGEIDLGLLVGAGFLGGGGPGFVVPCVSAS